MKIATRERALLLAILVLALLPLIQPGGFYGLGNLRNLAVDNTPVLVAAIGMTLVIVTAQIDISIGSQFALCGVVAGLAAKSGASMSLVTLITIAAGSAMGAINGWLVTRTRIPSIVVTLAALVIWRNAVTLFTGGDWIQELPTSFQWFGLPQATAQPLYLLSALLLLGAAAWVMRYTRWGRSLYAVGSSPEASERLGLRPNRVISQGLVAVGACTALAALLNFTRYPTIETNAGVGLELKVIAAVVVGGTAVTGGKGTVFGTFLGVILLGMIGTVFTFLHLNPAWEKAVQGAIILLAVVGDRAWVRKERGA